MVWGLRKNFFSNNARSPAAWLAQAIPRPARSPVVEVPGGDRRMLALVPDRQLPPGAVDVVVEHHQHAFRQVPAQGGHLVVERQQAVILKLRLASDRRERLERSLQVAIGIKL